MSQVCSCKLIRCLLEIGFIPCWSPADPMKHTFTWNATPNYWVLETSLFFVINLYVLKGSLFSYDFKLSYKYWSEVKWKLLSRVRLCDPMDYTVHWILQARILEWVVFPFSRGSSQPRDWTQVIAGGFFTNWATREAQEYWSG